MFTIPVQAPVVLSEPEPQPQAQPGTALPQLESPIPLGAAAVIANSGVINMTPQTAPFPFLRTQIRVAAEPAQQTPPAKNQDLAFALRLITRNAAPPAIASAEIHIPQAALPQAAFSQTARPQAAVPQAAFSQTAFPQASVPKAAIKQGPVPGLTQAPVPQNEKAPVAPPAPPLEAPAAPAPNTPQQPSIRSTTPNTPQEPHQRVAAGTPQDASRDASRDTSDDTPRDTAPADNSPRRAPAKSDPQEPSASPLPAKPLTAAASLVPEARFISGTILTPAAAALQAPVNSQPAVREEAAPLSMPEPAAPAMPAPAPATRPAAVPDINIQIARPEAPAVNIHLIERGGQVHVAVRTADTGLQTALRQDLGTLVNSLEHAGYRTEASAMRESAAPLAANISQTETARGASTGGREQESNAGSHSWNHQQQHQQQQQRHGRQQRPQPLWIEALEKAA